MMKVPMLVPHGGGTAGSWQLKESLKDEREGFCTSPPSSRNPQISYPSVRRGLKFGPAPVSSRSRGCLTLRWKRRIFLRKREGAERLCPRTPRGGVMMPGVMPGVTQQVLAGTFGAAGP